MTEQFEKMIVQTADVYGQKRSIEWISTPPVHNDAEITKVVRRNNGEICDGGDTRVTLGDRRFRQLYGTRLDVSSYWNRLPTNGITSVLSR